MTAPSRRDQFLDRRVDGRVLAADARTGKKAKEEEAPEVPREGGEGGCHQIDTERDVEQLLAAQPIGEMTEEQRTQHGAGEIGAAGQPDLLGGEMEARAGLQRRRHRSCQGDFETVEDPGDAERDHDQPMESAPRQPVEPGGHIGIRAADGLVWRHRIANNTTTALKVPFYKPLQLWLAPTVVVPRTLSAIV